MLPVPINTKTIQRSPVEVSKDRNDKHKKVISIYFLSVLIIGLPGLRKHVKLYVTQLLLKPNKSVQFNTTWALTHICVQRTFGNLQNNSLMNPGRIFTRTGPCNLFRDMIWKPNRFPDRTITREIVPLWAPLKKPSSYSKNRREDLEKSLWDALSAFLCWGEIRNLLSAIWPLLSGSACCKLKIANYHCHALTRRSKIWRSFTTQVKIIYFKLS